MNSTSSTTSNITIVPVLGDVPSGSGLRAFMAVPDPTDPNATLYARPDDLEGRRLADQNRAWVMEEQGLDPTRLYVPHELVDGPITHEVLQPFDRWQLKCDGYHTSQPNNFIAVCGADSPMVGLVDVGRRRVMVLRSGWRGATGSGSSPAQQQAAAGLGLDPTASIISNGVKVMKGYGSKPADLWAYVSWGARRSCYIVGDEVATAVRRSGLGRFLYPHDFDGSKHWLDLTRMAWYQLKMAGVLPGQIEFDERCNLCIDDLPSARQGDDPETDRRAPRAMLTLGFAA